jgi:hypothetical protein
LSANGTDCAFFDLTMSRDWSNFAIGRIFPNRMIAALARQEAAVGSQVALQIEPLHDAAS